MEEQQAPSDKELENLFCVEDVRQCRQRRGARQTKPPATTTTTTSSTTTTTTQKYILAKADVVHTFLSFCEGL